MQSNEEGVRENGREKTIERLKMEHGQMSRSLIEAATEIRHLREAAKENQRLQEHQEATEETFQRLGKQVHELEEALRQLRWEYNVANAICAEFLEVSHEDVAQLIRSFIDRSSWERRARKIPDAIDKVIRELPDSKETWVPLARDLEYERNQRERDEKKMRQYRRLIVRLRAKLPPGVQVEEEPEEGEDR